ncbi:MAG: hypothetical protein LBS50_11325 [Prevotellaceae bacterium]|jgi:hypothetical protein|nr:hypothetical protein [Prevotellaceae bacterium]
MRKLLFILIISALPLFANNAQKDDRKPFNKENCTCKDIPLHGKVKVVTSFADFKVQIVSSFPDLKVKTVTAFPDHCGEWQFVENFPDFTVQFVENFPNFKIQFVENFAGVK